MTAHCTEDAKAKSLTTFNARKSDRKGLGMAIHLSSQKSYEQIQQEMEEEMGRPVSIGEVFIRMHTKPDGTFVDLKAKKIAEAYQKNLEAKKSELAAENPDTSDSDSGPRELTEEDYNELFLQSTLRDDRGHPYGLGSLENSLENGKRKRLRSESSYFVGLQQQLREAQLQIEQQFAYNVQRDAEIAAREVEHSRLVTQQEKKIEHLSLVEKFMRETNPEFVDFMDSQPPST